MILSIAKSGKLICGAAVEFTLDDCNDRSIRQWNRHHEEIDYEKIRTWGIVFKR